MGGTIETGWRPAILWFLRHAPGNPITGTTYGTYYVDKLGPSYGITFVWVSGNYTSASNGNVTPGSGTHGYIAKILDNGFSWGATNVPAGLGNYSYIAAGDLD